MQYLGDIFPNRVLYFAWPTYAVDGSSITRATNGTVSVYKNDGTTQSTAGITDTEDFDALTGIHMCKIDTSADATFYAAGNDFTVVLSGATVDGKSVNAVLAHFSIKNRSAVMPTIFGNELLIQSNRAAADMEAISNDIAAAENLEKLFDGRGWGEVLQVTTIATLTSQTVFTLGSGSTDDDAYLDQVIVIEDFTTAAQKSVGVCTGYVGSTKQVTLRAAPKFTIAVTDQVTVLANPALKATVDGRALDVSVGGEAGIDLANVGSPTTVLNLSGTTIKTATDVETDTQDIQGRLPGALTAGGNMKSDALAVSGDTVAADALELFAEALDPVTGQIDNGTFAAGAIDAAAIAADAIGSSELAASAVTEIQSGLATAAALATVQADTDDLQTRLPAALVGGRMDSDVGALQAAVITAAAIATDAIGGLEFSQAAADKVWASAARTLTALGFTLGAGDLAADTIGASEFSQAAADKVWASAARTLTSLGFTLGSGDFAAGFLTAALIATGAIDADSLAADAGTEIANAILDLANGVETGVTLRQAQRLGLSVLVGKLSGAPGGPILIRDTGDTKDRVNATVDGAGNRTAVTLDAS